MREADDPCDWVFRRSSADAHSDQAPALAATQGSRASAIYVTPGHPVAGGAGYDCGCGQCLHRRGWLTSGIAPERVAGRTRGR